MTHFEGAEEGWWRENLVRCGPGDGNPTRAYPSTHRNIRGKPEPSHGQGCRIQKGRAVTAEHVLSLAVHSHLQLVPRVYQTRPSWRRREADWKCIKISFCRHIWVEESGDLIWWPGTIRALETKQIDCFTNSHCYVKPPSLHTSAVLF